MASRVTCKCASAVNLFENYSRSILFLSLSRRFVGKTYGCCSASRSFSSNDSNYPIRSNRIEKRRQKRLISRILRVDHAGEVAADKIYAGQLAILRGSSYGPIIQEMWDQEKEHVEKFQELLPKYKTRPTVMLPLWNVAGFTLGAGTALLGEKAAMACTIAVEEVIGGHYDSQLRELLQEDPEKYKELLETIQKFRDDELEHMNTGYHFEGEKAPFYNVLKQVIQVGCRGAIWLSERI